MARKASVRYWQSRGGFCCWHEGKQVLLATGPDDSTAQGPIYTAAVRKFSLLQAGPYGVTLDELASKYLEWLKPRREEATVRIRGERLAAVRAVFGPVAVASMTLREVEKWLDAQRTSGRWGDGTVLLTVNSLNACFNWGVKGGEIPFNPCAGMEKPLQGARGKQYALSAPDEARVLAACKGASRRFVLALRDTGARPGEIARAHIRHYDDRLQAIVYDAKPATGEKRHKRHRTGAARTIYLTGETLQWVERLCAEGHKGPIFHTPHRQGRGDNRGQVRTYTNPNIAALFAILRRRTGISPLIAYSLRHTFAVRWLRAGRPVVALAEVLGTSVEMVRHHYGHLADQHDYLRRLVNEAHRDRGNG